MKIDTAAVKSVLVLEYMLPLGCCVHSTPVYDAIKAERPEVQVIVATQGLGAALLRHNPDVNYVIPTPDALTRTIGTAWFLRGELRRRGLNPDCTLTGASDQRTRIALVGAVSGAGWRGGFTLAPSLYRKVLIYEPQLSLIDNNLRLAGLIGCREQHREPKVYFSQNDVTAAERLLSEMNPKGKPLVVIVTQNSGGQRTGWHKERFVQVIRHAEEKLGCNVVYAGTAADSDAIEEIRRAAGGLGTSLAGKTSVTELAALLAMSDAIVSLDTGTMHVGRSVTVPMVVIGPSWQRPIEWLPLGVPQVRILRGEDRDDIPPNYQLDEVQAEQVISALEELLAIYPPSEAARTERLAKGLSTVDHLA